MTAPIRTFVGINSLRRNLGLLLIFRVLALTWFDRSASAEDFEQLPMFQASKVVPADPLKGSNYKIKEPVRSDGFNYITVT